MTEARQVLKADYTFSDSGLDVEEIPGLPEAIKQTANDKETRIVRCEDRVCNYDVYWNSTTGTVRFAAIPPAVTYEVPKEYIK